MRVDSVVVFYVCFFNNSTEGSISVCCFDIDPRNVLFIQTLLQGKEMGYNRGNHYEDLQVGAYFDSRSGG